MTPILLPPNASSDEISSVFRPVAPGTGATKGCDHVASPPELCITITWSSCTQVAHNVPGESLSITNLSDSVSFNVTGKPASSEYCFVAVLYVNRYKRLG